MRGRNKIAGRAPAFSLSPPRTLALACMVLMMTALQAVSAGQGQPERVFENFETLKNWEALYFPKIKEHTLYTLGQEDDVTFLVANSSGSASALMLRRRIDVYKTPVLKWRWRVQSVYEKGDLSTKAGDDSPLRVYVMFEYDPDRAPAGMRFRYAMAKIFYGQHPPHASLNYVWASHTPKGSLINSAYTDRSRMLVLRSGTSVTGRWIEEEVNILKDYRRAFGQSPPRMARLAIMNDSDNTGEAAISHMDYIEVSPTAQQQAKYNSLDLHRE